MFHIITIICVVTLPKVYASYYGGCQYAKLVYKDNKCTVFDEDGTLNLNTLFPHNPDRCQSVTKKNYSFIEKCRQGYIFFGLYREQFCVQKKVIATGVRKFNVCEPTQVEDPKGKVYTAYVIYR